MDRRLFIRSGTTALGLLPALSFGTPAQSIPVAPADKPAWLIELIRLNDQQLTTVWASQISDPAHPAFGGVKDGDDIPNPQSTADFIRRVACALSSRESAQYQSDDLLRVMNDALRYLLTSQHTDGTIDLLATNFHSTPDTGFIVKRLTTAYSLLSGSRMAGIAPALTSLKSFLLKAGEALIVGGIHTPNHRWVVAAALAKLNSLWPDARYVTRIDQWLAEQIDMDADGQYNERSTLIYSPLTNRLLITIAKGVNKPALFDYVRRNLNLVPYYVHPNGEVVTEASGRQDKALIGTLEGYYYAYRFMALRDRDGQMAAMCRLIERTAMPKAVGYLDYFLDDPSIWAELPHSLSLPERYVKAYPKSGLVRIRRGPWDATILSANPVWFTFQKGNTVLQGVRLAASFFGKGQFQTETITQQDDGWVLTQSLDGPYYQPYPVNARPGDGDWEKMPRANRPQSEVQYLKTTVTIRETPGGIEAHIQLTGTERVPVALELMFRPGGTFAGAVKHPNRPNAWLLPESGSYTVQDDTITFGPGLMLHKGVQLRGALPATDAPTVYLTGFTPFDHTLMLS